MDPSQIGRLLFKAWRAGEVAQKVTHRVPDLDETTAYRIQSEYVRSRLLRDTVAGFKVGATAEPIRQALDLSQPLTGILFGSGAKPSGGRIERAEFRQLLVETELGFRATEAIETPIVSPGQLQQAVPILFPAFELAETGFFGPGRTSGVDMIAGNSACGGYILGDEVHWPGTDPDAHQVTLCRDGEQLYQARAGETLGGQLDSLGWLINEMISQGYRIEPGQIFLTGSLGRPQSGEPGVYQADYGPLGSIEFELT